MVGMNSRRYRARHSMRRPRLRIVGLVLGLTLVVGQSVGTIAANASGDTRGTRDDGSTTDITVVGSRDNGIVSDTTVVPDGSRDTGSGDRSSTVSPASHTSTGAAPLGLSLIDVADHQGEEANNGVPTGTFTNGEVKTYREGDTIHFRFLISSTAASSGTMEINWTKAGGGCDPFFTGAFTRGTIDNVSGTSPSVSPGAVTQPGDWSVTLSVSFTASGSARVNYFLTLSNVAGDCNGASQNTQFGAVTGDFKNNIGKMTVPVPANDIIHLPELTIIKTVVNDNGGTATAGAWTMDVTNANPSANHFPGSEAGVTITLTAGSYGVDESGGPSGYAKTATGDCAGTIAAGEHKTCTIINDDIAPQLTVIKTVVNDSGTGTSAAGDFMMTVTGTNPTPPSFAGSATGTVVTLDAGTYNVTESGPGGYAQSSSAGCNSTIAVGESKTCTVTNDDIPAAAPRLTIIKTVVNDNGGTAAAAAWTMVVTATNPSNNNFPGSETGVTITLDPGSYSVDESGGPPGYAKVLAGCSGMIAAGEHKTCTITNDDIAPQLTVIKTVVNDNGGTAKSGDFTMTVAGTNPTPASFPGSARGTVVTLSGGTYGVSETGPGGYTASFSAECTGMIRLGDSRTCTVTNDDVAPAPPPPPSSIGIQIVKGGPALAHVGDTITYTFAVSLPSSITVPLTNVTVTDPVCDSGPTLASKDGGNQNDWLEVAETWNYTCTHVVTASDPDPLPNTATARGIDAQLRSASDTDGHLVDIIHPAITILKTADPTDGSPGDTIAYTYVVTNDGDVDLTSVSVDDDVLGHICDIALLVPGQSQTCTADYVLKDRDVGNLVNVATAAGTDPLGTQVTDQDDAEVDVIQVLPTTVTPTPTRTRTPPGGTAFTGAAAAVPLAGLVLAFLLAGTGLLWLGRRRNGEQEV